MTKRRVIVPLTIAVVSAMLGIALLAFALSRSSANSGGTAVLRETPRTTSPAGSWSLSTTSTVPPTTTVATTSTTVPPLSPHVFPIQGTKVRYGSTHHDYPAADMFAACGSPVVAVTRARIHEVSFTDEYKHAVNDPELRGGLSVSYIDDDLVRYYGSHLSGIAEGIEPGVAVEAGQIIGFVGDTGNAAGTGCHLHFGLSSPCNLTLRKWEVRRGVVAPQPFLDAWRNGEDANPAAEIRSWEAANPERC